MTCVLAVFTTTINGNDFDEVQKNNKCYHTNDKNDIVEWCGSMCVYQHQHINAAIFKGFERIKKICDQFSKQNTKAIDV